MELRNPDPACNPYLALALCLTAGLDGIERGLEAPGGDNGEHLRHGRRRAPSNGIDNLPGSLEEAVDALESDALMASALGEHVFPRYVEGKLPRVGRIPHAGHRLGARALHGEVLICARYSASRGAPSPRALAVEGFSETLSRGPDMSRFTECGPGWLGFHRLAIMGLDASGMQPFRLDGDMCVCNGELYGFRPLKTELVGMGYRFRSGSDCEILLPMYREYGTDMFAMLDAEFACIIYDSARDKFVAARDPLGIRPLYYGELPAGGMAFASEPKNLAGVCREIRPFPPGHYWDGEFHRYADLTTVREYSRDGEEEAARHIRELLIQAVDKRLDSDAPARLPALGRAGQLAWSAPSPRGCCKGPYAPSP